MAETGINIELDSRTFAEIEDAYGIIYRDLDELAQQALPKVKKELLAMLNRVYKTLEKKHSEPWRPGPNRKRNLFKRTGQGLRDIKRTIEVTGNSLSELRGVIDPINYMETQEEGGEMEARSGTYMTIPLPAALDSRGRPKKVSPLDWDRTFVQRSKRGALLIFQRRGRNIVPLYVLKERVKLKPRLRLQETFDKELPYFERKAFEAIVSVLLR